MIENNVNLSVVAHRKWSHRRIKVTFRGSMTIYHQKIKADTRIEG